MESGKKDLTLASAPEIVGPPNETAKRWFRALSRIAIPERATGIIVYAVDESKSIKEPLPFLAIKSGSSYTLFKVPPHLTVKFSQEKQENTMIDTATGTETRSFEPEYAIQINPDGSSKGPIETLARLSRSTSQFFYSDSSDVIASPAKQITKEA